MLLCITDLHLQALTPLSHPARCSNGTSDLGPHGALSPELTRRRSWAHMAQDNVRPLGIVPDDQGNTSRCGESLGRPDAVERQLQGPLFMERDAHNLREGW